MSTQGMTAAALRVAIAIAIGLASFAGSGGVIAHLSAQATPTPRAPQNTDEIRDVPLQGNVHLLVGPDGNSVVQVEPPTRPERIPGFYQGTYGVLVVDTLGAASGAKLRAAVRRISPGPIRYIINTSISPNRLGGNEELARPEGRGRGAATPKILAHESILLQLAQPKGDTPRLPQAAIPTDSYLDTKELWLNGEAIQVFHQPNAHTDGDSIVFFRRSDVIAAGNIYSTVTYPVIDTAHGGSIQGIIQGLDKILELAIPESNEEGGTKIIPGHGRISDEADVVEYRNMVFIVRDRIQDMVKKGMTLEQVKAARPTLDYDFRYGAANPAWTTSMFIDAVYNEFKGAAPAVPARPSGRGAGQGKNKS